jgi:Protein of unknown function (DUF3060)
MQKLPNANDPLAVFFVCKHRYMKSEDDPEARIRELEQPLTDAARASETAANQSPGKWAPPSGPPAPPSSVTPAAPPSGPPVPPLSAPPFSPLPPLPYNDSFSGPPRRSQGRILWIAIAVFVMGMIALPIGIFLFSAHQVSRSGLPSMFPIPSFPSVNSNPSGTMPHTPGAAPSTSATTAPAGDNITVSGISEMRTIACNGGSVSVSGITNNVVITGHCARVIVSGIQNQITVDAAETIQASGSENQITYHTGSPTIGNSGIGNLVHKG